MSGIVATIDEMIEERSLLKHPFYQMWSDGKLEQASLAGYSKEYYQLVKAVPGFMQPMIGQAPEQARAELQENMQEESEHVRPWESFASALGVGEQELRAHPGLAKTRQAVAMLASLMGSLGPGAAAMYAFEKEIPKISQTKLDGLSAFYGISSEQARQYFVLHTEADIRHAASWQAIIEECAGPRQEMLDAAARSIDAQNMLLDACLEQYCSQ